MNGNYKEGIVGSVGFMSMMLTNLFVSARIDTKIEPEEGNSRVTMTDYDTKCMIGTAVGATPEEALSTLLVCMARDSKRLKQIKPDKLTVL